MKRAMAMLFCGSAVTTAALVLFYNWFFPDILPLASTEPQVIWRFEAAFIVTAITWITAAVAAVSGLSLLLMAFTNSKPTFEGR
ncbi:hypothetical protein CI1B_45600 [Bradyrhizobium ivorense]|uniref:Transmembrane protein n=1 Tax=Bradyrhizobium ivorense TaxID=2511166 RepID=A0A508TEL2_9BRAD|nr:hypothetical protein [Bradyrhizobium ivorense]VIO72911.1 hypothetical protein CI1B_45600 [Bradyrhizobium ivorense]